MGNDDLKVVVNNLQEAVAKELLDRINLGSATPAELSAAITFLKNNGISVDVAAHKNSSVAKLRSVLPFKESETG